MNTNIIQKKKDEKNIYKIHNTGDEEEEKIYK